MKIIIQAIILTGLLALAFWITAGEPKDEPAPLATASPAGDGFVQGEFEVIIGETDLDGLVELVQPPHITGNILTDKRMIDIALSRGYALRPVIADEQRLVNLEGFSAMPEVADSWRALKKSALADDIKLGVVSGYRSIAYQRDLFLRRFREKAQATIGRAFTNKEIDSGRADEVLNRTMAGTALPGFSKHQTGYAIDIVDLGSGRPFTEFGLTAGYVWLSADNYSNARRFGFIPSYPSEAGDIGPRPEPWEYVWVGTAASAPN